jgi:hypothetical protein
MLPFDLALQVAVRDKSRIIIRRLIADGKGGLHGSRISPNAHNHRPLASVLSRAFAAAAKVFDGKGVRTQQVSEGNSGMALRESLRQCAASESKRE